MNDTYSFIKQRDALKASLKRILDDTETSGDTFSSTSPLLFLSQLSTRFAREYKPLRETIHHSTSGKPSSPIIHTLIHRQGNRALSSSLVKKTREDHEYTSFSLSSVSNGYPKLHRVSRLITSPDHLSYFLVNPTIFDVSHGTHGSSERVSRRDLPPSFTGRRKCARIDLGVNEVR